MPAQTDDANLLVVNVSQVHVDAAEDHTPPPGSSPRRDALAMWNLRSTLEDDDENNHDAAATVGDAINNADEFSSNVILSPSAERPPSLVCSISFFFCVSETIEQ